MALSLLTPVRRASPRSHIDPTTATRAVRQALPVDPDPLHTLAQRAVDAARSAGATYADARLTRSVMHGYNMNGPGDLTIDEELIGVGVRVLVNGAWGFSASPLWDAEEVVRLAGDAVTQARANAIGIVHPVDIGNVPVATGSWATPITSDPFAVPIEDKLDHIAYWKASAQEAGVPFYADGQGSAFSMVRQEQLLVTSEGTSVRQTRYETGGTMRLQGRSLTGELVDVGVPGIEITGQGWELFQDAKLLEEFQILATQVLTQDQSAGRPKPVQMGRYTLVCDGATMAALLDATLGVATQLDRALGYEANAEGTSYLDDPLGMLGSFQVASPLVTVAANRSAATQLATVRWDDEGVQPAEATLVRDGVLVDFQTTREQAQWLAPYYKKVGRAVHSNGYAVAQDALWIQLQNVPNLALRPAHSDVSLEDLVSGVTDGVLVERGMARCDFQGRNGLLRGRLREIRHGRLGKELSGGAVYFNALDFWKHVKAIGGVGTLGDYRVTQFAPLLVDLKGEPAQQTSHTVQAPAAVVENQPVVDPQRKA